MTRPELDRKQRIQELWRSGETRLEEALTLFHDGSDRHQIAQYHAREAVESFASAVLVRHDIESGPKEPVSLRRLAQVAPILASQLLPFLVDPESRAVVRRNQGASLEPYAQAKEALEGVQRLRKLISQHLESYLSDHGPLDEANARTDTTAGV